jgi:murein DD-endopeptidase MepM/ murein hydrolase activator NlpD
LFGVCDLLAHDDCLISALREHPNDNGESAMKQSGSLPPPGVFCQVLILVTILAFVTVAWSSERTYTSPACLTFNALNNQIRDGRISPSTARTTLIETLAAVRTEYYLRDGGDFNPSAWVFPVAGYSTAAIDQAKGHGFISRGYNYFSGNRHGGHPAYDIFIHDRNQDCRDDLSGKLVPVISMTGGIVVALEKGWKTGSGLRGGNYIWVYDPSNELLVYYAHNHKIHVELGTIVKPGVLLAMVGRSGLNAAKHRSPTHLHFSVFQIEGGLPTPLPVYRELQQAGKSS